MATAELSESEPTPASAAARAERRVQQAGALASLLGALSSLRLTVALFAATIFLVFMGTLAQVDHDVWYVVNHGYFRVWFAHFEWQAFARLIEMFTKAEPQPITGGFLFPGGKLIGTLMAVNLLTAHAVRFKATARGWPLRLGLGVLAIGVAATAGVVISGMDDALESQLSPTMCTLLWHGLRASLAGLALAGAFWSVHNFDKTPRAEWWLATIADAVVLALAAWLFANPEAKIDDAGLRILWQLTKGAAAGAILLWGCWLVFHKRAGIVLLHAGVALLMAGELVTGLTADEAQMRIAEGETVNYAYDIRSTELAVVERLSGAENGERDRVTVVPEWMLAKAAQSEEPITHPDLPFAVRVVRFDKNSVLGGVTADVAGTAANPATAGAGLTVGSTPVGSASGVGDGAGINLPSAYIELIDNESGESLGVRLVSASFYKLPAGGEVGLTDQTVETTAGPRELALRFVRHYKPYSLTLTDFRFDRYVGTNTPKNYSSDVVLDDPQRGVDREVKIWMNNPLRYRGDTYYQSGFDNATERATVLQVVSNTGWMIPYVACMLLMLGMLAHFGLTLARFVRRRQERLAREEAKASADRGASGWLAPGAWRRPEVWFPLLMAVVWGGYLAGKARPPADPPGAMRLVTAGALPVVDGGRVKPLDTLARNTLQILSGRQVVKSDRGDTPATEWLLDAATGSDNLKTHRVFRIEHPEVLQMLGLESRPGSFRYTYGEVTQNRDELSRQVQLADQLPEAERSLVQVRTLQLATKLSLYHRTLNAFGSPQIGMDPESIRTDVAAARSQAAALARAGAPRVAPSSDKPGEWLTLFEAELTDLFNRVQRRQGDPITAHWSALLGAYARDDATRFNTELAELQLALNDYIEASDGAGAELAAAERLRPDKLVFETRFNAFSPFYYCAVTYLVAFLLTTLSWLGWSRPLGRAATAVVAVTLIVHTLALVGRIYISGRPPVTNLYSSAVFIAWAAVVFGLAFEAIHKMGIGTVLSSLLGFTSLLVAYFLSLDGDTFTVLQAVLDTQFWLATHVVCITLGYAATFVAGAIGAVYLVAGHALGVFDKQQRNQVIAMAYGTLCFAIFFSFVGTVLGGLWADDSWGRFWGWDPKENGALIIVLWNALVLHARWGKMVGPTGLAMLMVGGNIVTTWSWFGVNELGVGLHAYGGFSNTTSSWILAFAVSQLALAALGVAPFDKLRLKRRFAS
ncbi:Cytochrome c biogenesis protein CcsA [Pseudobythopirellula maris]|uniref:Cytochrome c biogenesis protein CcsA n=1 Tax=Pseudobythopirellula maris TaxID=2527991 RepID=A0A5C5ZRX6_9BACT|nr:cytochrome c biogenesis protein CcsA [Pseudobythopirellula maris]TWT89677.1 Cytochrome c biogenesis protein CcsA [Pseudobythopirellula maris]